MRPDPALEALDLLAGSWTTQATHPALPGVVVHGTAVIEWLEGKRFLVIRARNDHPDFPDSISIVGFTERDRVGERSDAEPSTPGTTQMHMHYFDSRGVSRVYEASIDDKTWRLQREAPGFSQSFTGTFAPDGGTITGRWQLRQDDVHWEDDLEITYRRSQ